ncbi:MAG: shikimate dehydrogenase [Xanthobacteraceae bacterium]|nr:shikimate dehydrogenase [Xanthobacteraceae bacterium]MBX3549525.1 shikimate dehydrogenase [Xanthobacteraceae bacterium]MCW5677664.1 shikimate dehydrogenase [Xanthobacteraceae bacterium]
MKKRACVIGYPVAHSRSPLIHGYWLRKYKIDGEYVRHEVKPPEIDAFLKNFANGSFVGCNVTLPHKEAAARNVAKATNVVRALGVANTLWVENDTLHGDNTDVAGYLAHLDDTIPGWDANTRHAIVLGAGGAARAIAYGLKMRGVETITIVNRSRERAAQLTKEIKIEANIAGFDDLESLLPSTDLLVNTTSLGMSGQPPLEINLKNLKTGAAVSDIVYAPLETELLKQARERGYPVVDGLGMLLHQAVPGFERWFGVRPKVTKELRDLIVADLLKGAGK